MIISFVQVQTPRQLSSSMSQVDTVDEQSDNQSIGIQQLTTESSQSVGNTDVHLDYIHQPIKINNKRKAAEFILQAKVDGCMTQVLCSSVIFLKPYNFLRLQDCSTYLIFIIILECIGILLFEKLFEEKVDCR